MALVACQSPWPALFYSQCPPKNAASTKTILSAVKSARGSQCGRRRGALVLSSTVFLRGVQLSHAQDPTRRHAGRTTIQSIWLDNRAEVVANIPVEEAYKMWEDRESIPQWMPWISSVKVQEDRPELSRWTLKWSAFNQNIELSWLARNLRPTLNQKIHWKSEDGLPNRGAVRFFKKGPSSCGVEMTISYEVPDFLVPFAAALGPLVESIIKADLDRFAVYAKKAQAASAK